MDVFTLNVNDVFSLSDEQFYKLSAQNRDLRFERTARGELVIMSPVGSGGSKRNAELSGQLWLWNRETGLGHVFDSSGGFVLPNGAIRSPDASWLTRLRWDALTGEQKEKFLPLCPDFVVELRSATDELKPLQQKMQEYLDNGLRLGWLINPQEQRVEIYRPGRAFEVFQSPGSMSGEEVLPGFVLDLQGILS